MRREKEEDQAMNAITVDQIKAQGKEIFKKLKENDNISKAQQYKELLDTKYNSKNFEELNKGK